MEQLLSGLLFVIQQPFVTFASQQEDTSLAVNTIPPVLKSNDNQGQIHKMYFDKLGILYGQKNKDNLMKKDHIIRTENKLKLKTRI